MIHEPLEIVRQMLQSQHGADGIESNRAHELAPHRHDPIAKDVFDPSTNAGTLPIVGLLLFSQRTIAVGTLMNVTLKLQEFQHCLNRLGAISTICPHRIGFILIIQ
jgi:hypothetical protein